MNKLNVLVTAGGSPGAPGIIKSLKLNGEREIRVICTDMKEDSAGLYLADVEYIVPSGKSEKFIPHMLEIAEKEDIDVIMPLSTPELMPFSLNKAKFERLGIKVAVSDPIPLSIANDRAELYKFLIKEKIPVPKFEAGNSFKEFERSVYKLGYPNVPVCFKPRIGNGGRGFRVLKGDVDKLDLLLNHKPDSSITTFEDISEVLENANPFPSLVVMEYLDGDEYSTDLLVRKGTPLITIPRKREATRLGVSFTGRVVNNPEVIAITNNVVSCIGLDYNINIQLKYCTEGLKLIEINPRMSGTIILCTASGANIPYLSAKMAMGEEIPEIKPVYNTKMIRHWEEVFLDPSGKKFQLKYK